MARAISDYYKFLFIHIPKTGGTSLFNTKSKACIKLLSEGKLILCGGHLGLARMSKKIDISKYFKFAIVRNPWDRFISLWLTRAKKLELDEFIERIKLGREKWYALRPCIFWIGDSNNNILVDKVLRYENYKEEVTDLMKKLGLHDIASELPHLRKTNRHSNYRGYYTNEWQVEFVKKFYDLDIKTFNYDF